MLGPITELTLDLLPLPPERWAIVFFFAAEDQAAGFIDDIRLWPNTDSGDAVLTTIDFFDEETLLSIRQLKSHNSRLAVLPNTPAGTCAAVYVELQAETVEEIEGLATRLLEASAAYGCDSDAAWAFSGEQELARARRLCHAAQEAMHSRSDQERMVESTHGKLTTDMRMIGCTFAYLLGMYRSDLQRTGLKAGIFGHAGDLHLQVHFLPENHEEYLAGKHLIDTWARLIDGAGGSIANGHGVGKLRKSLLRSLPLPGRLSLLCQLKSQLDPTGMFNPANMLDGTFHLNTT
jgi:D-lactate dehydrogenase (cytochrome)